MYTVTSSKIKISTPDHVPIGTRLHMYVSECCMSTSPAVPRLVMRIFGFNHLPRLHPVEAETCTIYPSAEVLMHFGRAAIVVWPGRVVVSRA